MSLISIPSKPAPLMKEKKRKLLPESGYWLLRQIVKKSEKIKQQKILLLLEYEE